MICGVSLQDHELTALFTSFSPRMAGKTPHVLPKPLRCCRGPPLGRSARLLDHGAKKKRKAWLGKKDELGCPRESLLRGSSPGGGGPEILWRVLGSILGTGLWRLTRYDDAERTFDHALTFPTTDLEQAAF